MEKNNNKDNNNKNLVFDDGRWHKWIIEDDTYCLFKDESWVNWVFIYLAHENEFQLIME